MKKVTFMKSFFFIACAFTAILMISSCEKQCLHIAMTESVIAPTCDSQGKTVHLCSDCGYTYDSTFVAPIGHATMTSTVVEATCDSQGYTQYICQCGYKYTADHIPPTGHQLDITKTPPTCSEEGFDSVKCTVCEYAYINNVTPPTDHTFEATTTHTSVNTQCGSTTYTCHCGFSYVGDFKFYSDIYQGAFTDNTSALAKGLDTSKHNHITDASGNYLPLDWQAIKAAGFDFVILRAGFIGVKDPVFEMDYAGAKAAGLDVGVYFYTYADTVEEARAEAECLLEFIKGKSFEYPIYFDIEDNSLTKYDRKQLTDICIEFISIIQQNGYFGSLYSNNNWLVNYLDSSKLTTLFDVWYARYPTTDILNEATWNTEKYGKQMCMWQFSKTGTIDGFVNQRGEQMLFDLNYAYKDYPSIIAKLGYNGLATPEQ